jgi:hypothetical protein
MKRARDSFEKEGDEDKVEEVRRDGDPMYHMLFFPYTEYMLPNGVACCYLDRVLFTAIDICKRRVGLTLTLNATNKRVFNRIVSPEIRNFKLKITFLWMLMFAEPVVQDFIKSLYKDKERLQHFKDMIPYILNAVRYTLAQGFDEFNIRRHKLNFFHKTLLPACTIGKNIYHK